MAKLITLKNKLTGTCQRIDKAHAQQAIYCHPDVYCISSKSAYKSFLNKQQKESTTFKVIQKYKLKMSLQAEINRLQAENIRLHQENQELKREQEEFFAALDKEITDIENSPKAWRWFRYGALLWQLIGTIKQYIDKRKK